MTDKEEVKEASSPAQQAAIAIDMKKKKKKPKNMNEGSLRKWFKGSKSKDGKGGWVNVVTGGTCASDEPGEGTPKCVSSSKRASMTKAERDSASRRKKKADPGQQSKSGAAKPTYVATDKKKKVEEAKDLLKVAKELTKASKMHKGQAEKLKKHADDMKTVDEACWKGYKAYGMKKKGGKMVPNCKPVGSVKKEGASYGLYKGDGKVKIDGYEKMKAKIGSKKKHDKPAIEIDERTLSSYIPSDRQGEASAANREYVKSQLKKKEDESTKNRGDLSKRDAGKMAKQRLHNKRIMSMGEAKVDKGRSDYGKASIRNYRRMGPGHGEPAMFDPENKRGKLIDKRREEHKSRRGVKGAKVPAYKTEEVVAEADKKGKGSGTKDACYHKVKASAKVWPSAYASGRLVQCRKKGAANYGKSKSEGFEGWADNTILEKQQHGQEKQVRIRKVVSMRRVGSLMKRQILVLISKHHNQKAVLERNHSVLVWVE